MIYPLNSYIIEIALLKKILIILTQFTNKNIEFIFTKKNIYIYAHNEESYIWIIIDDLYGKINFTKTINFKKTTYIQLSIPDIKIILRDFLDSRQGYGKFIKIGSLEDRFIIRDVENIFKSKNKDMKIYNPPLVNNYKILDPRYGDKIKYYKILDNIAPYILSEFNYDVMMYNNASEISIISQEFTILINSIY